MAPIFLLIRFDVVYLFTYNNLQKYVIRIFRISGQESYHPRIRRFSSSQTNFPFRLLSSFISPMGMNSISPEISHKYTMKIPENSTDNLIPVYMGSITSDNPIQTIGTFYHVLVCNDVSDKARAKETTKVQIPRTRHHQDQSLRALHSTHT